MRVLVTCPPGFGHLNPIIPLAAALRDRGHRVVFASSASFAPAVTRRGFDCIACGLDWTQSADSDTSDRPQLDAELVRYEWIAATATASAGHLLRAIRELSPDVLVHDFYEFGAHIAAEIAGIRHASVLAGELGPLQPVQAVLLDPISHVRRYYGLERDETLKGLFGELCIDLYPIGLRRYALTGLTDNARSVLPDPTGDADWDLAPIPQSCWQEWLAAERALEHEDGPIVFATLGTVYANRVDVLATLVGALANQARCLVVGCGPGGSITAPARPRGRFAVVDYVPQSAVIPHCDVVVHHAGYGATVAALTYGKPALTVPLGADQPANSAAAVRAGVAKELRSERLDPDTLGAAIGEVLTSPGIRAGLANYAAASSRLPTMNDAVGWLEELASGKT